MEGRECSVLYYRMSSSSEPPFREWRQGIRDEDTRVAIDARIARLRGGNSSKSEPVGEGVWEVKINHGPGYRIYYAMDGRDAVLLLLGGDKSTQTGDIEKAKRYWSDHKERKKKAAAQAKKK